MNSKELIELLQGGNEHGNLVKAREFVLPGKVRESSITFSVLCTNSLFSVLHRLMEGLVCFAYRFSNILAYLFHKLCVMNSYDRMCDVTLLYIINII